MRQFFAIVNETFLSCRRDRVFFPAVLFGMFWFIFAQLVGEWTFDQRRLFVLELGLFGFHLMGGLVAIQWGIKLIQDAKRDGAIELQLAAPIARSTWIIGKFTGLVCVLFCIGLLLFVGWNILLWFSGWPFLSNAERWAVFLQVISWSVLAAVSIFFSSMGGAGSALFSSVALWIVGLASAHVENILPASSSDFTRWLVQSLAIVWNLTQFNVLESAATSLTLTEQQLGTIFLYGVSMIGFFLSAAIVFFSRRDVV